jgi:hypothetical protein
LLLLLLLLLLMLLLLLLLLLLHGWMLIGWIVEHVVDHRMIRFLPPWILDLFAHGTGDKFPPIRRSQI